MREAVSVREVNQFRKGSAEYLTDKASVYRLKNVGTGLDERPKGRQKWPDDYAAHLTDASIRVRSAQLRKEESVQAGQVRARGGWKLRFEDGADIVEEDVVKLAADTRTVGLRDRVFNIIGLLSGSDEITRIAEATEVT